jgi:predicted nucleotide-binding protein
MVPNLQETKRKFNEKATDLLRSNGHTIENAINIFLDFCESDQIMANVASSLKLSPNMNLARWYEDFSKSGGSMIGSGKFLLPTNDDDRLALLYQLLLGVRRNEISYPGLCLHAFGATNTNQMAFRFNDAISRPLVRGLLQKIEEKERGKLTEKPRQEESALTTSNRVFVVHGRDETLKAELEIFLRENGLEPVVLHRKPDEGLTLIEKLEKYSDVSYAFILLTPDDIGYLKEEEQKEDSERQKEARARQNVIFELGYFVARLGRNKVCCLYKPEVKLPTDFRGVLYKKVGTNIESIAYDLLKELRAARLNLNSEDSPRSQKSENATTAGESARLTSETIAIERSDPTTTFALFQLGINGLAFSWFLFWVINPIDSFSRAVLSVVALFAILAITIYAGKTDLGDVTRWCKVNFPLFLAGALCVVVGSLALQRGLLAYRELDGVIFRTHLEDAPRVSSYLISAVMGGGVLLDLPALSRDEMRRIRKWFPKNKDFLLKVAVAVALISLVISQTGYVDSYFVLGSPRPTVVETRYVLDGVIHIYQIGVSSFGAYAQSEKIVHVLLPFLPLVTISNYSFPINGTEYCPSPKLGSAFGLSASISQVTPNLVTVQLLTANSQEHEGNFTVSFCTDLEVTRVAYISRPPTNLIAALPNGTEHMQVRFVIINQSPYELSLDNIVLYAGGYAPIDPIMSFSRGATRPPSLEYDNASYTCRLYGSIPIGGNLTISVDYNGR